MPREENRLAALEKAVKAHDARIAALEKKLDPKTASEMSAAALDMLLAELGKEDM